MAFYYSPAEMLAASRTEAFRRNRTPSRENAKAALQESLANEKPSPTATFDIFLSYKWEDIEVVSGVYRDLVRRGYAVYIDHVMDPQLSRTSVTVETVETLRARLVQSKTLFYAITDHSSTSTWMPWELGFADGFRGKAAIVPITEDASFKGTEFVSVYPRVVPLNSSLAIYGPNRDFISFFEAWRDSPPRR